MANRAQPPLSPPPRPAAPAAGPISCESERARAESQPFACVQVELDRHGRIEEAGYGEAARLAVDGLMQSGPAAEGWLAMRSGERWTVARAGAGLKDADALAHRLIERARGLRIEHGGRGHRIGLSAGMAHATPGSGLETETLLRVAEEGLRVARAGGGDRCVHTELYALFQRQAEARAKALESGAPLQPSPPGERLEEVLIPSVARAPEHPTPSPAPATERAALPPPGAAEGDQRLLESLQEALHGAGSQSSPVLAALQREIAALAGARDAVRGADGQAEREQEMEILQRRIDKLNRALTLAEEEILRLQRSQGIETGLSSIYREVQGLSADERMVELKRELMTQIFEANVALREQVGADN